MAKFTGRTVAPGSPAAELASDIPQSTILSEMIAKQKAGEQTGTLEEETAAAAPIPTGSVATDETQAIMDEQEQIERERIEDPYQRLADKERVDKFHINEQNWKRDNDRSTDGGIRGRAKELATNWQTGKLEAGVTPRFEEKYEGDPEQIAEVTQQNLPGSPASAFAATGAVKYGQTPGGAIKVDAVDPAFLEMGSLVTENFFADGVDSDVEAEEELFGDTMKSDVEKAMEELQAAKKEQEAVARNYNNVKLGQQIHRDYQRMKQTAQGLAADDYKDISQAEANALGTVFKELYARNNPDLIEEVTVEGSNQKYFRVTPKGSDVFAKSKNFRAKMFPKAKVRPAKTPQKRQKGEGKKYTKSAAGALNRPVGVKTLREAADNLGEVPNVVNPQRMRLLFATALPALLNKDPQNEVLSTYETINNFGIDKLSKMKSKAPTEQEAFQAYNLLKTKIAQEIYGVASERNGANFLTYYLQAFNGRLSPQQTHFDPTSSKTVRFVTANADPVTINPNSRQERNLRQMYALMLVKGADMKMPEVREQMLTRAESQMETWGDRLNTVLNESMTDAQSEAVAEAIAKGVPLDSSEFPQITPLALDPQADAELLKLIKSKGEDGLHFIDGLIDFSKYIKAKRAGKPYHSFFNAYIDGKTNGLAANGIQMGSRDVAYKTGVMRDGDVDLLDDGDLRDAMQENLVGPEGWLNTVGFTGSAPDHAEKLLDVANIVFRQRALHKATTMTFGYGKDAGGFIFDIDDTIAELAQQSREQNPQNPLEWKDNDGNTHVDKGEFAVLVDELNATLKPAGELGSPVGQTLLAPYREELERLMSKEAMAARGAMRQAAIFSALLFEPMRVKTHTGYVQEFGGKISSGYEGADVRRFNIYGEGKKRLAEPTVADYKLRPTAAAIRKSKSGKEEVGGKAYGGAIPGPVQSLDAATVAMTVTGKSWEKMKAASGGKTPYIHTIYDAFKSDANSYDVMLEEVNNNWLKANEEWSYLQATKDGYEQSWKEWQERYKDTPDDTLTTDVEPGVDLAIMAKQMAFRFTNTYGYSTTGVKSYLTKFFPAPPKGTDENKNYHKQLDQWSDSIMKELEKAGYSYNLDTDDSPPPMTMKQLKAFNKAFFQYSRLNERFQKLINETNDKKKKLISEIRASGKPNYQYYAH